MGFGTIFATTVMVVILGISTYLFITGAVFSMDTWSNSLKEINRINNERLKTAIEIEDISVTSSEIYTRSDINVSMTNTGSTKILNHDFSHIDHVRETVYHDKLQEKILFFSAVYVNHR